MGGECILLVLEKNAIFPYNMKRHNEEWKTGTVHDTIGLRGAAVGNAGGGAVEQDYAAQETSEKAAWSPIPCRL